MASDSPKQNHSKEILGRETVRTRWALALLLAALHPLLLSLLFPVIGDASNILVFIAPVAATLLFGWRIGLLFISLNVVVSAVVFKYIAGRGAEDRPKMVLVFIVLLVICFGADRLRRYIIQRRTLAEELDQAKKLEAIGRLAGGVAHDMNNTLNAILASVYAHRKDLEVYDREFKDLDNIVAACERGAQLTRNLLGFARKSNDKRQIFPINEVVSGVQSILERTASKQIRIETHLCDSRPHIEGDRAQIENAVMNLCLNSLDAMRAGGTLTLASSATDKEVTVSVSDTGTGMEDSVRAHVFEPFFTTKAEGKGTGLGLSMVYGVVHAMKGRITLSTAPGQGTMITCILPRAPSVSTTSKSQAPAAIGAEAARGLRGRTVLIIDDEPLVLRAGVRMLDALGCKVLSAGSGDEGIACFTAHRGEVDLVVVDLIMPDKDGVATLEAIFEIDATTPVLLVSGYTRESEKLAALRKRRDKVRFLAKPYQREQLILAAREILDSEVDDHASSDSA